MKKVRVILLYIIIFINSFLMTGCWNYKEIESLSIVAGTAIDKGQNSRYRMTVEVVKISGGKDTKTESELISTEGETVFDCARNAISISGKRLYWSHNKLLIIGREIAEQDVVEMIDWFNRDSETRANIHLVISTEKKAEDIFKGIEVNQAIKSFELDDMLKNEAKLSKAPQTEIHEFANNMAEEGINASVPTIKMKQTDKGKIPTIGGTAVFKGEKMIGLLDEDQTKDVLFARNKIKGGLLVLVLKDKKSGKEVPVTLEIFKSKTKVKSNVRGNEVKVNINIETTVALAELGGTINLIEEEGRKELVKLAEANLEKRVKDTTKKIQQDFGVDILGFGKKIYENDNKDWKKVKNKWDELFKNAQVNVTAKVHIKNSAMLSNPLEVRGK